MKTIAAEELKKKLDANEDLVLVNVLSEGSFQRKHIPGSINVPEHDEDFVQKFQQAVPDKTKIVIVYCASKDCPASPNAARKLEQAGYQNVIDFEDGILGWDQAGYAFEGEDL